MIIVNDHTPTSELTAIKPGDEISNGLGTFGTVEEVKFAHSDLQWEFVFALVGGGYINAIKHKNTC